MVTIVRICVISVLIFSADIQESPRVFLDKCLNAGCWSCCLGSDIFNMTF